MATNNWALGTTLGYSAVGGGAGTIIAKIEDIDDKKLSRKKINLTTLDSANQTEECRAGMVEVAPFKFKILYNPAVHVTLLGLAQQNAPNQDFKITFNDSLGSSNSNLLGTGYISSFTEFPKATPDNVYEAEIEIQPVGKWAYTVAT